MPWSRKLEICCRLGRPPPPPQQSATPVPQNRAQLSLFLVFCPLLSQTVSSQVTCRFLRQENRKTSGAESKLWNQKIILECCTIGVLPYPASCCLSPISLLATHLPYLLQRQYSWVHFCKIPVRVKPFEQRSRITGSGPTANCCDKSPDPVLSKLWFRVAPTVMKTVSRRGAIQYQLSGGTKLQTGAAQEVVDNPGEFPPCLVCVWYNEMIITQANSAFLRASNWQPPNREPPGTV